jgi:hypothetical protein
MVCGLAAVSRTQGRTGAEEGLICAQHRALVIAGVRLFGADGLVGGTRILWGGCRASGEETEKNGNAARVVKPGDIVTRLARETESIGGERSGSLPVASLGLYPLKNYPFVLYRAEALRATD